MLMGCGIGLTTQVAILESDLGTTVDFGTVYFSAVAERNVILANRGSFPAEGLSASTVEAPFGFKGGTFPGTGGTCGAVLAAGASCALVLTYQAPATASSNTGTLTLRFESTGRTLSSEVPLAGASDNLTFTTGSGFNNTTYTVAAAQDGTTDIYIGGLFTTYNGSAASRIARLRPDGSISPVSNFGTGFNWTVLSIVPLTDGTGRLYVGGDYNLYQGVSRLNLVRLFGDGTVDTAFSSGGGFDVWIEHMALALDGSGDLYVGGRFTTYRAVSANRIVRLDSDGNRDAAFAIGTGFDDYVERIVPATDGSGDVYVGGDFLNYNGTPASKLVRLNSDGSLDTGFAIGTGANAIVRSLALTTDGTGDIYVGGNFSAFNGVSAPGLLRLTPTGVRASTFDAGLGPLPLGVFEIELLLDNSILMGGGAFTHYNGTVSIGLAKASALGTYDATFAVGTGLNNATQQIIAATDGTADAYAVGDFTTYQGTTVNRILRLSPTGKPD